MRSPASEPFDEGGPFSEPVVPVADVFNSAPFAPASSSALSTSCEVFGSSATMSGVNPHSRSAANDLGPRARRVVRRSEETKSSRGYTFSTAVRRARVPTPVRRITRSRRPACNLSANCPIAGLSGKGVSRIVGADVTQAPSRSASFAISPERRLSKITTRRPSKLIGIHLMITAEALQCRDSTFSRGLQDRAFPRPVSRI